MQLAQDEGWWISSEDRGRAHSHRHDRPIHLNSVYKI